MRLGLTCVMETKSNSDSRAFLVLSSSFFDAKAILHAWWRKSNTHVRFWVFRMETSNSDSRLTCVMDERKAIRTHVWFRRLPFFDAPTRIWVPLLATRASTDGCTCQSCRSGSLVIIDEPKSMHRWVSKALGPKTVRRQCRLSTIAWRRD